MGWTSTRKDGIQGRKIDVEDEVSDVSKVRRVQSSGWAGDYGPIQMDPRARPDDVDSAGDGSDPLEEGSPCLTIGQVEPRENEELVLFMR